MKALGVKLQMSTSGWAQTDGQSEVVQRSWLMMLRTYVSGLEDAEDWVSALPLAQFCWNNSVSSAIGQAPNSVVYGRTLDTPLSLASPAAARQATPRGTDPQAAHLLQQLAKNLERAKTYMRAAQERYERHHNRKHRPETFAPGDKVYVSAEIKHGWSEEKPPKLRPLYYGPYPVLAQINPNAYRIKLPTSWQVHDVVNVSKLRRHKDGSGQFGEDRELPAQPGPVAQRQGEEMYIAEAILSKRSHRGRPQYKVRWAGWDDSQATWQCARKLAHDVPGLVAAYEEKIQAQRAATTAALANRSAAKKAAKQAKQKLKPQAARAPRRMRQ
jgi:hypothetical protein